MTGLAAVGAAWAQAPLDASDPSLTKTPKIDPARSPMPNYPAKAKQQALEGEATVEFCIDASGRPTSYTLKKSTGHEVLDEATLIWAKGSKFQPAEIDAAKVAVCRYTLTYEWKLNATAKTAHYAKYDGLSEKERPKVISPAPEPEYPAKALAARAEGNVKLSLCLDATGKVEFIGFLTPALDDSLEYATGRLAMATTFSPAVKDGVGIGVCRFVFEHVWKLPN